MVRRVVHQYEMGVALAGRDPGGRHLQVPVVERCHDIAADRYERRLTQQLERVLDAAQSLERVFGSLALARVPDARVVAGAVAERVLDQAGVMRGVDDELANASPDQRGDLPFDQHPPASGEERFGDPVRQRPHPLTAPGREDQRFHPSGSPAKGKREPDFSSSLSSRRRRSSKAG